MTPKKNNSTIKLSISTKKELAKIGKKEDSYEDIVKRLINNGKKKKDK